jgi:hypothetical protein
MAKTYNREKTASSANMAGFENWISACRKLKLHLCLSPCTSINSQWTKVLNVRPETLKLVQKEQETLWK